ncbi:MAG: hypothetical protein WAP03_05920 [Methylorubrum rhodinum]|uniref:hypothetical protein n=1 Tax=Methylorubrum rhodinum TaxID=29428 RepID=UPI003BB09D0D
MSTLSRDEVIAAIYGAASEPDGLSRIAYTLRTYLDVDSAGIWFVDRGGIVDIIQTADIAESVEPYLQYYRTLDPWTASRKTPGRVYLGSDTVDEAGLLRSEFYNDFARHFGMVRPMGLVLDLEPGSIATLALNRSETQRFLGEADRAVLQDLAIHLKAALSLRGRIQAEREVGLARSAALDAVRFAVVVCDGEARVRTLNAAAGELAASGLIGLGPRGGGLTVGAPQDGRTLQALVRSALQGQPGAMRARCPDGTGLSILVTPTRHEERSHALICLTRDDTPPGLDAGTLVRLFGVSPAQAELCLLLLAGRTFEEAAAERGIATSTARSYFALILARTGARNLRDLLRLLTSLPQIL